MSENVLTWESRRLPWFKTGFAVPLSGIAGIDCSVALTGPASWILLFRRGEAARYEDYRRGAFGPGEVASTISFLAGLRKIDVSQLKFADKLELADLIRRRLSA
jgi:hypothetical protein